MERLIKKISKDIEIVFDNGKFDMWCVYIKSPNGKRPPLDTEYFNFFISLGKKYTNEKVYKDFVKIYDLVTHQIKKEATDLIIKIAKEDYKKEDSKEVAINFTVIYAGMVAEQNKQHAVLKERIKRLGMYQILVLNHSSKAAANFSKGKKAKELDLICKQYGF